jgi:hypothetical protein
VSSDVVVGGSTSNTVVLEYFKYSTYIVLYHYKYLYRSTVLLVVEVQYNSTSTYDLQLKNKNS